MKTPDRGRDWEPEIIIARPEIVHLKASDRVCPPPNNHADRSAGSRRPDTIRDRARSVSRILLSEVDAIAPALTSIDGAKAFQTFREGRHFWSRRCPFESRANHRDFLGRDRSVDLGAFSHERGGAA